MNKEEAIELYKHIDEYDSDSDIDLYPGSYTQVWIEYRVEEDRYCVVLMVHDGFSGPPTFNFYYSKEDWANRRDDVYDPFHPHL